MPRGFCFRACQYQSVAISISCQSERLLYMFKNLQLFLFFNADNPSTPTVANPSDQRKLQRRGVEKAHHHKEKLAVEAAQELPPPPSSDDSSVSALPSQPDSPWIICSQYRQAQHDEATTASPAREEPPTFIMVQERVSDQRRRIVGPEADLQMRL